MSYLLFVVYLLLACFFVPRMPFVRKTGLGFKVLLLLFLVKIAAGLVLGFISIHYYPGNDYEALNFYGQQEYSLLMQNPGKFFSSTFSSLYATKYGGWLSSTGSFWNDLEETLLSKLLGIFNMFSRGNYYINSLFFNSIGFLAPVALFRMFDNIYPARKKLLIIGCFFIPSTLYFSSGLHKDAMVFTAMAFYFYSLYFLVYEKMISRRIILLALSLISILLLRNYVGLILIPLSVVFILSEKFKWQPVYAFGTFFILLFFLLMLLPQLGFNPLTLLTQRREAFEGLGFANTALPAMQLEPTLKSMIANLPAAIANVFLRPFPWALRPLWLLPFVGEMLAIFVIIGYSFFQPPRMRKRQSFILLLVIFAVIMMLITGYIVTNSGSIIRYRSLYLPFCFIPFLATLPQRIKF